MWDGYTVHKSQGKQRATSWSVTGEIWSDCTTEEILQALPV